MLRFLLECSLEFSIFIRILQDFFLFFGGIFDGHFGFLKNLARFIDYFMGFLLEFSIVIGILQDVSI